MTTFQNFGGPFALLLAFSFGHAALAQDTSGSEETWSVHGQATFVDQYHPGFSSAYRGPNSLDPGSRGMETMSATFFGGVRLWDGGQAYINPEIDQGFGLSGTFGIAAFPNGNAYKVGAEDPYFRLQRLFFRQEIDLGGDVQAVAPAANQLGMSETADNLVITLGKFSVVDVFDTNSYAHDPTSDFLNWAIIDSGAFDYAADSWAYSYGASVEWTQNWWTLRSGFFAMSRVPNGPGLQRDFSKFQLVDEAEARVALFDKPGKIKLLAFLSRAPMGAYDDAVRLGIVTNTTPSTALVRKYRSRLGFALNMEQPIADDLGAFLRAGFNNGEQEAYEFTDMNESVAAGVSLSGTRWKRADDTVGVAAEIAGISQAAQRYFAAGGLGTLIGDGQLPYYATEDVVEAYYSAQATSWLAATFDYQLVLNPAYNRDRGPVSIFALRLHVQA